MPPEVVESLAATLALSGVSSLVAKLSSWAVRSVTGRTVSETVRVALSFAGASVTV